MSGPSGNRVPPTANIGGSASGRVSTVPAERCGHCGFPCLCWTEGILLMSGRCCIHGEYDCRIQYDRPAEPTAQEERLVAAANEYEKAKRAWDNWTEAHRAELALLEAARLGDEMTWDSMSYAWGLVRLVDYLDADKQQLKAVHGACDDDSNGLVVVMPYHAYKIVERLAEAACDVAVAAARGEEEK